MERPLLAAEVRAERCGNGLMRRTKLRVKLRGSIGVPCRVVNTRPNALSALILRQH